MNIVSVTVIRDRFNSIKNLMEAGKIFGHGHVTRARLYK
jgi:hypothetical protein